MRGRRWNEEREARLIPQLLPLSPPTNRYGEKDGVRGGGDDRTMLLDDNEV